MAGVPRRALDGERREQQLALERHRSAAVSIGGDDRDRHHEGLCNVVRGGVSGHEKSDEELDGAGTRCRWPSRVWRTVLGVRLIGSVARA